MLLPPRLRRSSPAGGEPKAGWPPATGAGRASTTQSVDLNVRRRGHPCLRPPPTDSRGPSALAASASGSAYRAGAGAPGPGRTTCPENRKQHKNR